MIAGALFYWLVGFVPLFGWGLRLLMVFYVMAFFWDVIGSSANGDDDVPGWPDATDMRAEVFRPALMFLLCGLVCMLPALVVGAWLQPPRELVFGLIGAGTFYLPMAMLAVVLFDSIAAVRPTIILPAILKILMQYIFFVAVILAVWILSYLVHGIVAGTLPRVRDLLAAFLFIYEGTLVMRATGLIYRAHAREIGWFFRQRGVCRACGYDLRGTRPARSGAVCPECGAALSDAVIASIPPARP